MSSRRRLSGTLEELVTSLAREEEEEEEEQEEQEEQEGHGGEEWNSFEENMLVAATSEDASAPGADLAHWVAPSPPPAFLSRIEQQQDAPSGKQQATERDGEESRFVHHHDDDDDDDDDDGGADGDGSGGGGEGGGGGGEGGGGGGGGGGDRSDPDSMSYMQSIEEANHWSLWQYQYQYQQDNPASPPSHHSSVHDNSAASVQQQQQQQSPSAAPVAHSASQSSAHPSQDIISALSQQSANAQQHWDPTAPVAAISSIQQTQQSPSEQIGQHQSSLTSNAFLSLPPSLLSRLGPLQLRQLQLQQQVTSNSSGDGLSTQIGNFQASKSGTGAGSPRFPHSESRIQLQKLHPQLQRLHLQRLQQAQLQQQLGEAQISPVQPALAQLQLQQLQQQRHAVQSQLQQLKQIQHQVILTSRSLFVYFVDALRNQMHTKQAQNYHQQVQIQQAQLHHQAQLQQLQQQQAQIHAQLRMQQQPIFHR